jgi:DNA-binding Xre family transcriptional regulator
MVNLMQIRTLAVQKKITIRQLAKEVGITEQGLQSIIRNNTTTTDNLEKISKVLLVPVSTFFEETESIVSNKNVNYSSKRNNDSTIDELVKQNGVLQKQVSDLIHMQLINAESIRNLSGGEVRVSKTG